MSSRYPADSAQGKILQYLKINHPGGGRVSYEEIAAATHLPINTVRRIVHQASFNDALSRISSGN